MYIFCVHIHIQFLWKFQRIQLYVYLDKLQNCLSESLLSSIFSPILYVCVCICLWFIYTFVSMKIGIFVPCLYKFSLVKQGIASAMMKHVSFLMAAWYITSQYLHCPWAKLEVAVSKRRTINSVSGLESLWTVEKLKLRIGSEVTHVHIRGQ